MLKQVKARYEHGRLVAREGASMPPDGTEVLVVFEAGPSSSRASSLYGAWRGAFPSGMDLDGELRRIRSAWTERLENTRG